MCKFQFEIHAPFTLSASTSDVDTSHIKKNQTQRSSCIPRTMLDFIVQSCYPCQCIRFHLEPSISKPVKKYWQSSSQWVMIKHTRQTTIRDHLKLFVQTSSTEYMTERNSLLQKHILFCEVLHWESHQDIAWKWYWNINLNMTGTDVLLSSIFHTESWKPQQIHEAQ